MPFYEPGFPLLLIPGGGLNSALSSWQTPSPFNPMERYRDEHARRFFKAHAPVGAGR